ncbi:MAG: hypothetical protein GXY29_12760 [Thermotogaceae bacterium]|nr:hypothetical protein [Thermotogaceae bacterium]
MKVLGKGYGFILVILLSVTAFSALDGFNPETILIGKQVWMLKNYHPSMISPAPKVKGVSYLFRSNIDPKYGTLLTYEEAVAACPEGWHLPTMAEWNELFALYGGLDIAGGHLKTVDFWKAPNTGADNLSGFSALPAGGGNDTNRFDGFDWSAHFWSDTLQDGKVFVPTLMHDSAAVFVLELPPKMRASVRYLKDTETAKENGVDLTIPLGIGINPDGKMDLMEWEDALQLEIVVPGRKNVNVFVKHDGNCLCLCFQLFNPSVRSVLFPEVLIDPGYNRSAIWMTDDWWLHVSGSDCESIGKLNDYNDCALIQEDWIAEPNYPTGAAGNVELIEMMIPFSKIGLTIGAPFGFSLFVTNTVNLWKGWPETAKEEMPSSWASAILE